MKRKLQVIISDYYFLKSIRHEQKSMDAIALMTFQKKHLVVRGRIDLW